MKAQIVTVGNFDGVHLGHQKIIRTAIEKARAKKGTAIAYTFRPHPRLVLKPEIPLQLLTTYDEKVDLLKKMGIDLVIEEQFTPDFSTLSAEEFFAQVLRDRLKAESIVVGYNFAFGKGRSGHLDSLTKFCHGAGIELIIVPPQSIEGEVASSSRIREYLLGKKVNLANALLGRPFFYHGVVEHGERRGKKMGFPTANIKLGGDAKLVLPYGVYATWAVLEDSVCLPSVTNVGVRPTFHKNSSPIVETYLLEERLDLYEKKLEIQFIQFLRDEQKFPSGEELRAQIARDVEEARKILLP